MQIFGVTMRLQRNSASLVLILLTSTELRIKVTNSLDRTDETAFVPMEKQRINKNRERSKSRNRSVMQDV